jgi:DNA-binding protein H-NS
MLVNYRPVINRFDIMNADKWAGLSLSQLLAERQALDAKINTVRADTRGAAIDEARRLVDAYDLSPARVMPLTRQSDSAATPAESAPVRKKVAARYYDPNSGQTWTGRGKPPRWIAGQDYNKYLIPAEGILRQMAQQLPPEL